MKRYIAFIALFGWIFLLSNRAFADSRCEYYCRTDSNTIDKATTIRCLVDYLRLQGANLAEAKRVIRCVVGEWKRKDGAIGHELSDAFLASMEANPQAFFSVMKENEAVFSEWISELQTLSFTWYKDPPSPLEDKRRSLIGFLSEVRSLEREQDVLRKKLLSTISNIKPRQVE